MDASALLVAAMGLAALGGAGLAALLWRHGAGEAGTRPLAVFILLVGGWSVGLASPNRFGIAMMALAPMGGAAFVHFAASLAERADVPVRWTYAAGTAATLAALLGGSGRFVPWSGTGTLFRYDGIGLAAAAAATVLAGLGHAILIPAWRKGDGLRRRQVTLVLISSGLGLASVTGLAFPLLGIEVYPWPLLLLPLYLVVLAYAVLRYRLMAVNRWAVRAVCWGLLIVLAAALSAITAGSAAGWAAGGSGGWAWAPFLWTAVVLLVGMGIGGPVRRLADRLVHPGGDVSAADLARWRQSLAEAADDDDLMPSARRLLNERLKLPDTADPPGFDRAPPGARRVAEVMADLVAQAALDLDRRRAFAERQRLAELGALAATVAHDLRNPMNIIAMATADAEPETRGEIRAQLARMDALVRDLLDYAKPWRVDPAEVDLAAAVAELDATAAAGIPAGLLLRADPGRLRQALVNLLDNANAVGGRVLVTAERNDADLVVDICDDGPGIPADIRPSLFRPFVSRSPGGTGLGLAIVAKVMAAHGGSVSLIERPGWSTCFRLRFPQ